MAISIQFDFSKMADERAENDCIEAVQYAANHAGEILSFQVSEKRQSVELVLSDGNVRNACLSIKRKLQLANEPTYIQNFHWKDFVHAFYNIGWKGHFVATVS